MNRYPQGEKRFLKINLLTIIALFVLILAGGVVRSTGSGMGCPDWPKCFDRLVPPTDSTQLPAGYEQKYIAGRKAKNERFANMLDAFGKKELADKIRTDASILQHEEFNAAKTWTEYVNRLVGATTGVLLLLCAVFSRTFFKNRKRIVYLSWLNVVAVGFQAWLGSIVVSTNLMPWIITVHMLMALLILGISIYTYFQARALRDHSLLVNSSSGWVKWLAALSLVLTVVQVTIGTSVREEVDVIASSAGIQRTDWVSRLGVDFTIHRDLAFAVLLVNLLLFFAARSRFAPRSHQSNYANAVLLLVLLQLVSGLVLAYMGMPPFAQTAHLVLASLLFGAQYYLMLLSGKAFRPKGMNIG